MRNFKSIIAAAVLFLAGVTAANAQLTDGGKISVSVPDAFVLRDKTFPAGVYTITRTPSTIDSPSLLILRGDNEAMIFDTIKSDGVSAARATQLIFDTVGGTSYLTGIAVGGDTTRLDIPKTKRFKQALTEGSASRAYITVTNTGF